MTISELVERTIMEILERENGSAELQRKELASLIGCVPSQINYVISSRFTPEQGYIVESRRGGGGYIRISRVRVGPSTAIMHIVNCIGMSLDASTARVFINDLAARQMIGQQTAKVMLAAISDAALRDCPAPLRDSVRAAIVKQMLVNAI